MTKAKTRMIPSPLTDGCLIIDNSMVEQLQHCPRSYQFKYLNRRIEAVPAPGRNFGSCLHAGLATRYKTFAEHAVTDVTPINDALSAYLLANPQPENDFRNLDHAFGVMRAYNRAYPEESFKILATEKGPIVESSFLLHIGSVSGTPIKYAGRIDLGIQDSTGLWVVDHKTAFQFGKAFEAEMAMDTGQLGYCFAFRQVFGQKPNGYITNAIRIRKPTRSDAYEDRAPVDASDFKRLVTCVDDDRLEEFVDTVMHWARNLLDYHWRGTFPRVSGKKGCVAKYGQCEYYTVCQAPRPSRDGLLASSLYEDNKWTPINQEKEKTE